jgi:hypothetical protein
MYSAYNDEDWFEYIPTSTKSHRIGVTWDGSGNVIIHVKDQQENSVADSIINNNSHYIDCNFTVNQKYYISLSHNGSVSAGTQAVGDYALIINSNL